MPSNDLKYKFVSKNVIVKTTLLPKITLGISLVMYNKHDFNSLKSLQEFYENAFLNSLRKLYEDVFLNQILTMKCDWISMFGLILDTFKNVSPHINKDIFKFLRNETHPWNEINIPLFVFLSFFSYLFCLFSFLFYWVEYPPSQFNTIFFLLKKLFGTSWVKFFDTPLYKHLNLHIFDKDSTVQSDEKESKSQETLNERIKSI